MSKTDKNLLLFGSQFSQPFQQDLTETAFSLGMGLIPADVCAFASGERFCELYPNDKSGFIQNKRQIENANVHIVISMQDDPSRLLVDAVNTIATVKEYGAASVHVVMGFAPFARQDRAFEGRMVSQMAKTFPAMLHCAGADRLTTIDVHSKAAEAAITTAFGDGNVRFLSAVDEIYKAVQHVTCDNVKFGAPDGADKPQDVAQRKARAITRLAYGDDATEQHMFGIVKNHKGVNATEVAKFIGDVTGCDCVEVDDMVDTGGTLANAAHTLRDRGAKRTVAAATHGIFSANSLELLTADYYKGEPNPIERLLITDTIFGIYDKVAALPEKQGDRVKIISTAPIIKQALILAMQ